MLNKVYDLLKDTLEAGHSVWVAGNGGSYSDAHHLMGELRKGFRLKRPVPEEFRSRLLEIGGPDAAALGEKLQLALPVFALELGTLGSAIANDQGGDYVYAQQLMGAVRPGDAFVAISTSGNSCNLYHAAVTAKALGAATVALTGRGGGRLHEVCDLWLAADEDETYKVQEQHVRIYHELCMRLEEYFFTR